MPDDIAEVGGRPQSVFIHGRNIEDSPPSGKIISVDNDGYLLIRSTTATPSSGSTAGVTVGTSSTLVLAADPDRLSFILTNAGPNTVSVALGPTAVAHSTAAANSGHAVLAGGTFRGEWCGDLSAISPGGAQVVNISTLEGV